MDQVTLQKILADHRLWLKDKEGGERANLSGADLYAADLREADLYGADLREANLSGARLDFSVLPLRCGGLRWKIDARIAAQIAYHFCSMECDDPDFIRVRNNMLDFANRFHRVDECGRLLPIQG
jgi:uncharacterized protein YjbI with pentapeptide repeats